MHVQSDLLTFLRDRLQAGLWIDADSDLIDTGVLDSLMLLDLILRIERVHGVVLNGSDVTRANFATVAQLAKLVVNRMESETRKVA